MPDGGAVKWDHPRRCGENASMKYCRWKEEGSPPQVRGKLLLFATSTSKYGITPAGAGKTSPRIALIGQLWDHPRRCGENSFYCSSVEYTIGSPPQVRGKQKPPARVFRPLRITPAGAGKTNRNRQREGGRRDHPRRCGENAKTCLSWDLT